jgi:DNA recombination protein RmuC
MMEDLGRLRDRVLKLQQHHTQTSDDLRQILISSEKIEKRATRIEELEFDGEDAAKDGASGGAQGGTNVIAAPVQRRLEAGE